MTHPRFDYATSGLPWINKSRFIGHHLIQRKAKSIYWASKQTKWPFLDLMMMILMMWSCIFFHKNVMFSWERVTKPATKDPSVCFLVPLLGHCFWKLTDGPTEQNLQSSWVTVCSHNVLIPAKLFDLYYVAQGRTVTTEELGGYWTEIKRNSDGCKGKVSLRLIWFMPTWRTHAWTYAGSDGRFYSCT